ncbi:hypothetical protein GC194_14035, partial [bacterium]|nr:hypothetical protein [bacterium]
MKTPVLLLAIFTQLTAWAIHQEINYSGLSSDSATTLSTCISKGRVFGAINFNYSYSTNCDTFYYESFGNLALCKYNKAMLIEKVQVIQNFFVNRRIFNVDMVATDQHIYLLGSAHGPIIAANDTFTVTNSAPIVLKINANSMKVEAVSELKNDFGNCQLKLLENNNNLYVVAMSPQPFNCAPYFNQKKQLILLKANTSFVFVPAFAKEFKRNPNFLDEMTFKKN